jgi:hypothetical protein
MLSFEPDVLTGRCYIHRDLSLMILGREDDTYFISLQKTTPNREMVQCSFIPIFVNSLYDFIAEAELIGWGNPSPIDDLIEVWKDNNGQSWKQHPQKIWNLLMDAMTKSGQSIEDLMVDNRIHLHMFVPEVFDVRRN